jgi:hypothetical protein
MIPLLFVGGPGSKSIPLNIVRGGNGMQNDVQVTLTESSKVTVRQDRWSIVSAVVAIIAVLVSCLALAVTIIWNSAFGDVKAIQPSGYAVIRGDSSGYYSADRLVLPLEWSNITGSWILIRRPQIVLHELGDGGKENDKTFHLAGEYKDMSPETLSGLPQYKNSLSLEPHSVTTNILVFNVEEFWAANSDFRFRSSGDYRVYIK